MFRRILGTPPLLRLPFVFPAPPRRMNASQRYRFLQEPTTTAARALLRAAPAASRTSITDATQSRPGEKRVLRAGILPRRAARVRALLRREHSRALRPAHRARRPALRRPSRLDAHGVPAERGPGDHVHPVGTRL